MAESLKLSDMYFDVLLRDRTSEGISEIEKNIKDKLKLEVKVGGMQVLKEQFASVNAILGEISGRISEIVNKMSAGKPAEAVEHAEGSFNQLRDTLRSVMNEWKAMGSDDPELQRVTAQVIEATHRLNELKATIKDVAASANELANLEKRLDELRSDGSNAQRAVTVKEQIAAQTKLLKLQERAIRLGIGTADAGGTAYSASALQQLIAAQQQLNALKEREQLLNDPSSSVAKLEAEKQANAARAESAKLTAAQAEAQQLGLNVSGMTRKEIERMVELQKKLNALQNGDSYENQSRRLQQGITLQTQINSLYERELQVKRAINDARSSERYVANYQQEMAMLEQILKKQAEIFALKSQQAVSGMGAVTVADAQAQLAVDEQLIKAEAELNAIRSQNGKRLRERQVEIALEKQLVSLKVQEATLRQRLADAERGAGISGLKQQVTLEEQLVALKAKKAWLEQQSAHGSGTNAQVMRQLQQAVRELLRDEEQLGRIRLQGAGELRRQGGLMESLKNMARNYIGAFGAVSFIKSLYRITGEYERQTVALKALMQSASQAATAVGELQQMALKSPFSFAQLTDYAKRLSAYQIANHELLDTTKKLADLSAGLGVDMGRIILAYGHVQSASYLSGYVLRQFTMAGVPMVQALADQFTKLEGRVVTVSEVFDRISKKQVSFEAVKNVLDDMTDVGGRFYNHQEKMVETVYGKINRLGDAWTIMMSKFGESKSGWLKFPLDVLTSAMQNWRTTISFLISGAVYTGMYRLAAAAKSIGGYIALAKYNGLRLKEFFQNNWAAIRTGGIFAAVTFLAMSLWDVYKAANDTEKAITEMAKNSSEELSKYLDDHKEVFAKIKVKDVEISDKELKDAWSELQRKLLDEGESVELARLFNIDDLRERTKEAIELIENFQKAKEALQANPRKVSLSESIDIKFYLGDLESMADYGEELWYVADNLFERMHNTFAKKIAESYRAAIAKAQIDADNEEQGRAFVKEWIKGFEAEHPEMTEKMRELFEYHIMRQAKEAGINVGHEFTYAFEDKVMGLITVSDDAIKLFFRHLNRQAKNYGENIEDLFHRLGSKNSEEAQKARDLLVKMSEDAYNAAEAAVPGMLALYGDLFKQIEAIAEMAKVMYQTTEPTLLQSLYQHRPGAMEKIGNSDLKPNGNESFGDYTKRMHQAKKDAETEAKRRRDALKKARDAEDRARLTEDAKKYEERAKEAQDIINDLNLVDYDKNGKDRNAPKTKHGSKKDPWLEAIKARIKEYEDANKEIDKLVKAGKSYEDAVERVLKMTWTYVNNEDFLGDGGMKSFAEMNIDAVKRRLKAAPADKKSQYQELVRKLEGFINDQDVKEYAKGVQILDEELKRLTEATTKEWELYDKLLEQTGDKGLAAMTAFGLHRPVFNSLLKQLEQQFKDSMGDRFTGFDDLLNMNTTKLKETIGMTAEELNLLNKIRDLRNSTYVDAMEKGAAALKQYMTVEQQVDAQRAQNTKTLDEYIAAGGKKGDAFYNALVEQGEDAVRKIKADGVQNGTLWDAIFGDMDNRSFSQVRRAIALANQLTKTATVSKVGTNGLPEYYKATYTDAQGANHEIEITAEMLKELQGVAEDLYSTARQKNSFKAFATAISELRKNPKAKQWKAFAEELANMSDTVSDLAGKFSELAEAAGSKDLSRAFQDAADALTSISSIAQGYAQGGVWGALIAGVGETASWITKIFNRHDEILDELISKLSIYQQQIEYTQERIKDLLTDTLGGIYTVGDLDDFLDTEKLRRRLEAFNNEFMDKYRGGTTEVMRNMGGVSKMWDAYYGEWLTVEEFAERYGEANAAIVKALHSGDSWDMLYASLFAERENLRKQYEAELDKKNTDEAALEDYQQKIADLDKEIRDFAKDMAQSLYDIDVNSWAKDLTDAIVDAWAKGEDAVKNFKDKAQDLMKTLAKNIISQKIMEVALQPVLDLVEQEMTGKKGRLDEGSIVSIADMLYQSGLGAIDSVTGILEALKQRGLDLSETASSNTIGQGIQSVTEDTANLLASYINAIRADVSVIRTVTEQQFTSFSAIAQSQVEQLNMIAQHTLRNATAAERIEDALNSVIQIGSDGPMWRV